MKTTTFIYTLQCPKSGDVRYVGKSNKPKDRFYKHIQMADNNHHKNKWINDLKLEKLTPILSILDEVLISEWKDREKFYISKFRELGCDLFNTSIGGEGLDFGNQTSFKPGNGSKKIVCLLSDGTYHKTFDSGKESAEYVNKHNISSVLKGVTKKAGGYIWVYEDIYNQMSENELNDFVANANNNLSSLNGINNRFKKNEKSWNTGLIGIKLKPNKNIHQYTKEGEYIRTWETAKQASISITGSVDGEHNISKCARGEGKTAFKYKWSYNLIEK